MRIVIAGAVVAAFVAGRYTADPAVARPLAVAPTIVSSAPELHCPERVAIEDVEPNDVDPEDVEPEELDDPDAIDIEQTEAMRLVKHLAELEASLGSQGGLRGRVRDAKTGESMVGVTVVAYGSGETYTSITDEGGWYEIAPIPENTYTLTLYYIDAAVEYTNVRVTARQLATFDAQLDPSAAPERIYNEPSITIEYESEDLSAMPDEGSGY